MSQMTLLRYRPVQVVGPSVAILILYMLLFQLSLGRQCKQELVKLNKLASATKLTDVGTANQQLASLQSETEALNEHLQSVKRNHQTLVARQIPTNFESEVLTSPAKAIADIVELLEQNGLVCVSSELVPNSRSSRKDPAAGNAATLQRPHDLDKREIKLCVLGSFEQMRSALGLLRLSHSLWLRSLEMDESDGLSVSRSWTLTVDAMEVAR